MIFEELVQLQYELGDQVEALVRNYGKDSKSRKTSAYYSKKLESLAELGKELLVNHQTILALEEKNLEDPYFTEGYYDTIKGIIVRHTQVMERGSMELINMEDGARRKTQRDHTDHPEPPLELPVAVKRLLRDQRALIRCVSSHIDEVLGDREQNHPPSYYTVKAAILDKRMSNLAITNSKLWEAIDDDEIAEFTPSTFYELEAKAEEAMAVLHQHIPTGTETQAIRGAAASSDIPLPRITIPTFTGNYARWVEFRALYTELVHNAVISNAKKMHYLISSLEGEPKNLIKHLPVLGESYDVAWSILTNRYDNKRLLVSTILNRLLSQPAMKRETATSLKLLHDVTKECLHGLQAQELPVQHWDTLLSHILLRKLDQDTTLAFERGLDDNRRLVTVDELMKFLEHRFLSMEGHGKSEVSATRICASITSHEPSNVCQICNREAHKIYQCKVFEKASLKQRWKWVKEMRLCVNCLKPGHRADECSSRSCTKCTKRHNSLLHNTMTTRSSSRGATQQTATTHNQTSEHGTENSSPQPANRASLVMNANKGDTNYVLLGTARLKFRTTNGQYIEARAVLDSGSQVNLITERLLKKLGGIRKPVSTNIEGVGSSEFRMRHQTRIGIKSRINEFQTELVAHVIPKIVSNQPTQQLNIVDWGISGDISLADPEFHKPGRIECLLGAEVFFELIKEGRLNVSNQIPPLQESVFGWVVAGKLSTKSAQMAVCGICSTKDLEKAISRFWECEEIPKSTKERTEDEMHCEAHFLQNTFRGSDGKFVVSLPLKDHPSALTKSRGMAYQRFKMIENRLAKNPELRTQYVSFMRDYEKLGHMTRMDFDNIVGPSYFIPHHCVFQREKISRKFRVVFDASAHTSSGVSLNDIMYNGPTVQSELFAILLRFRLHKYVAKTDVEKMYRQIWVNKKDRNLQLIMWRESPSDPVQTFQLNTVTYGTRSAPYLATRCLVQLADEFHGRFPPGAESLKRDFYVDDGLIGADTVHETLEKQHQLISILSSAGMKLRKWSANHPKLLSGIAPEDLEVSLDFNSEEIQSTKTLGILWLPKPDMFCVRAKVREHKEITKRSMSSELAQIYDPLGLIGPVIVTGKIQLQHVWQMKLDWDERVPPEVEQQWISYISDFEALNGTTVPRYMFGDQAHSHTELHVFADASEKAYGACVYIKTTQGDNTVKVNLLCSRSRIAPIKSQTIPRLELCAALLAAELMARVQLDLSYQDKPSYLWTDSQIVLSWIHNHPGKLPVFVAHRISKIHRLSIIDQWRHVPSKQNPADLLSRGIRPREFSSSAMWLHGPTFLYRTKSEWPVPFRRESLLEHIPSVLAAARRHPDEEHSWIYSIQSKNSFAHIQRVIGYVLRFIKNTRKPNKSRHPLLCLSPMELDNSLKVIVRQIQTEAFPDLKGILVKDKFVPGTNNLSSLTPFLDEEGIVRVGGRLSSSNQQFDAIHQMLLPSNDPIVRLLVEKIHKDNFHCGPQALLGQVRHRFWPLKGKSLMRSVVQHCVRCTKARPVIFKQIMGNLPRHRVQPARPFLNSGVDYCGPFWVHYKTRGKRPQKAYLAVFCCFATKAIHLELVTDLTTEAFLGALRRFISRRGHCKALYCDNATNFVGARNQLNEMNEAIFAKPARELITNMCSNKGIEFHFIPPRSPHFGGLWEAAVKSAKHLLLKNVSPASLTYEELETVVVEVEGILNSRPLIPCSSDANDLNAITPAHFLIGEELTSSVDLHAHDPQVKLAQRWKLVSQLKQSFWQRWSTEYLNELQQRHKWKGPTTDVQPNTMVIVREDNLPVLHWPLGRIIKTYKGEDGFVRVCDVKTSKGTFKRPIHRLAPLFSEESRNENLIKPDQQIPPVEPSSPRSKINEPVATKRPRINQGLLLTIVTLLLLPVAMCNPVNVTKFSNKPGVYFEEIGKVRPISASWNIIVFVNLSSYRHQMTVLSEGIDTLKKLCVNASDDTACTTLLHHFNQTAEELNAELKLFAVKRRFTRGALNIVGNVANSLFGVLDSNYAEEMSKKIDSLRNNDEHLESLLKRQTSLIDSTINVFKKTESKVQTKFKEVDNKINKLLFAGKPINDLLLLSVQLFMITSKLQRAHSALMNVLIDTHHDKLNPLLLTPQQLSKEILKIRSHIPPDLELPITQNNLMEMYRISKVNGILTQDHVIVTIDIPLTEPREFKLFHLTPIMASRNNTLTAVQLSTDYLAISAHRDEFHPMMRHDVEACIPLMENELLCPNMHAMFHEASSLVKCEIDLFNNNDNPRCNLHRSNDSTQWYQLNHPNQWIYATTKTTKLNAVCGPHSMQLNLESAGLMTMSPDCTIKGEHVTIKGSPLFKSTLRTSITPLILSPGQVRQYEGNELSTTLFTPPIEEFRQIQEELSNIKKSTFPSALGNPSTHILLASYTALTLFIIIIIALVMRRRKVAVPKARPIPAARQSLTVTQC